MPEQFGRERGHQFDTEAESHGQAELRRQIEAHQKLDARQSYLSQAVGLLWRDDARSLKQLKTLYQEATQSEAAQPEGKTAKPAKELSERISQAIKSDRQSLQLAESIKHYTSAALKSAALFFPGRIGLAGTLLTHGLDQARPADNLSAQFLDGALGSSKGGLLRGTFHSLGTLELGIAAKGVSLGVSSRILDIALSRQNYSDQAGNTSLAAMLERLNSQSLNRTALAGDVITFALSHGLFTKLDHAGAGQIRNNPFLATVLTSSTFGFSAGATSEIIRQQSSAETFDPSKVLKTAVIQGGLDSLAAMPGGLRARSIWLNKKTASYLASDRGGNTHPEPASLKIDTTSWRPAARALYEPACLTEGRPSKPATTSFVDEGGRLVIPKSAEHTVKATAELPPASTREPLLSVRDLAHAAEASHLDNSAGTLEILSNRADIVPLAKKLSKYTVQSEWLQCPDPAATGPFESYEQFTKTGLILHSKPTRIYDIDGMKTKLLIPEEYAQQLDEVSKLRHSSAELSSRLAEQSAGPQRDAAAKRWSAAERLLSEHPLKDHPIAEDFVAMLERLPDSTLVKQIVVRNESDPNRLYNQQVYGKNFESAATASKEGVITFYLPRRGPFLVETVTHEWSHLADYVMPETRYLFNAAAELERRGHYARHYGRYNDAENYAVHLGEELLNCEPVRFTATANAAPIRTTILMLHGLEPILKMVPESQRSPHHAQFTQRVEWVRRQIAPVAETQLLVNLSSANPQIRRNSAQLLIGMSESPRQWVDSILRLRTLTELDLARTQIGDEDTSMLGRLDRIATLRKLSVSRTEVSDKTLDAICQLSSLRELDLSFTQVTDTGLLRLQRLRDLNSLNLLFTQIGDHGVAHLAKLPNLYELHLPNNGKLTDHSAQVVSNLTRMQTLRMGGSGITDGALAQIAKLHNLIDLKLNFAGITDYGLIHLLELNHLFRLSLRGTKVSDEGVRLLADGQDGMHTLDVGSTKISDKGLAELKPMRYLAVLELDSNNITNAGVANLSSMSSLGRLNLRSTKITDDALRSIRANHPNLQELDLSSLCLSGYGLRYLADHPTLKSLKLSCNTNMNDIFLAQVGKMRALENLDLSFSSAGDSAVAALSQHYSLRTLNLAHTKITDGSLETLKKMLWLEEIRLNGAKLSYKAVADLRLALPGVRISFE